MKYFITFVTKLKIVGGGAQIKTDLRKRKTREIILKKMFYLQK